MRLLNTTTHRLESFGGSRIPLYAILSHRWSAHEITFQDLVKDGRECWEQGEYAKLRNVCSVAAALGLEYVWIDTCCIDKTSSSELSQAINSMYRWYREAVVCFAYLADVPEKEFGQSEWFERGWTLQELVAPPLVIFLNSSWEEIGTKSTRHAEISEITGIPPKVLLTGNLAEVTAAQKMSWAANRKTTVVEDRAYCMIGLFGVSMPMIYGEGEKAFLRLQEEIVKVADDLSLFVWKVEDMDRPSGLLAQHPGAFKHSREVRRSKPSDVPAIVVNNKGIHLTVTIITIKGRKTPLALVHTEEDGRDIGIWLSPLSKAGDYFERKTAASFLFLDRGAPVLNETGRAERRICVRQSRPPDEHQLPLWRVAAHGHAATMKLFLAQSLAIDTMDAAGRTPLCWAVEHGNGEVVRLLLSKGAKLELKDKCGVTALLRAAMGGDVAMIRMLLYAGASIGSRDLQGRSALSHTAANGHVEATLLLLNEGANAEVRDLKGRTPLALAAMHGHKEIIKALLEREVVMESKDHFGVTPLSHAARCGSSEAAKVLIEAGADLRSKDETDWTALRWAMERGNQEMVQLLLESGAKEEERRHRSLTGIFSRGGKEHLEVKKTQTII